MTLTEYELKLFKSSSELNNITIHAIHANFPGNFEWNSFRYFLLEYFACRETCESDVVP